MNGRRGGWRWVVGVFGVAAVSGIGIAAAELLPGVEMNRPAGAAAEAQSDGTECASGIAIDVTLGMVCSDICSSDADCTTAGWACRKVYQDGLGERVGICFPRRVVANP